MTATHRPQHHPDRDGPRRLFVVTANINGDDVPHMPVHDPDLPVLMFIQELGGEAGLHRVRAALPHLEVVVPNVLACNLAIAHTPGLLTDVVPRFHQAHPSAAAMAKDRAWDWQGHPWPADQIPSFPRGVLVANALLWGDVPISLHNIHPVNSGHTHHPDRWTPPRRHLADLCWDVEDDQAQRAHENDRIEILAGDTNWTDPPAPHGLEWLAFHTMDRIGATRGAFTAGHRVEGRPAGHKGKVHHRSVGAELTLADAHHPRHRQEHR